MADVVIFVHGTGVREERWAKSFALVRQRLRRLDPAISVHGCFWGSPEGAELSADGASIPRYAETRDDDRAAADEELALWAVLYTDPWYELRLLSNWPDDSGELAPGQIPTSVLFSEQIASFTPSAGLSQVLESNDLRSYFDAACGSLRAAPEFERVADAATEENLNELRKAVARALVAATMISAVDSGTPSADGETRDLLVGALVTDLNGYGMGIASWLGRPFKGVALRAGTWQVARKRGAVSDATAPGAGDIIRYQARGSGVRRYIRQVVADAAAADPGRPVTLLAHSLGGIACVDAMIEEPMPGVERLITVGSQAPFFYEIDALVALPFGEPLPAWFPAWLNIYDQHDFLSYIAAGVFAGRVTDKRVDNGQPFPQAHSAYWRNDSVWQHIAEFLGVIAAARTYAVVVGIEQYEAGNEWRLDGPADSALRVIGWLRECGVPAGNITVLLSPLDANRPKVKQRLAELGLSPEPPPATVEKIRQVVTEQLPEKDGDLLVLFWSGHGVLDRRLERRLFCADAGVHAKYNINVTDLLAALSGKNFKGLRRQVVIVDACANFIHEMRLKLQAPESGFALGDPRPVSRDGLLAAAQGERAVLDPRASLGQVVADWLDGQARTLPLAMDLLTAHVLRRFEQLHADGVTAQHPVRIQEILHGEILHGTEHVFGGNPVPEHVQLSARSAGLTTAQLRATAEVISRTPQLATEHGRVALMQALHGVVGPMPSTGDPEADLLDLVSVMLDRQAGAALFQALLGLAASDDERIAARAVRHRLELQAAVAPLLGMLRRTPLTQVLGALAGTTGDAPEGIAGVDQVLESLADLRTSRLASSPLAEFVVRLQHRRPDLEVPAGWFSAQGMDEATVAALRASVAAEARRPHKLVIDLRDSVPGGWQTMLTGYLGPGWFSRAVTCDPTADGVRRAVAKIVDWARSQAADFAIGFLIRLGMLRELPELWEYEDEIMAPTRLCEEYPVVLHAAERMTVRQLQLAWDSKLAAIEAAAGGVPGVLWLDQDDARAVRHAVQESDAAYVAFSFVPQAGPDARATALMAAIAAGAPHVMWVRAVPASGYDLRGQLGKMAGPIKDFPVTLRQGRRSDRYLSEALRVIWDSADELPPYLERLGEELVPNG